MSIKNKDPREVTMYKILFTEQSMGFKSFFSYFKFLKIQYCIGFGSMTFFGSRSGKFIHGSNPLERIRNPVYLRELCESSTLLTGPTKQFTVQIDFKYSRFTVYSKHILQRKMNDNLFRCPEKVYRTWREDRIIN